MAYKYIGDATLGVGLTVTAPKPLDSRSVVSSLKDLYTLPKDNAYQGMTVANVSDGNMYMLIDKNKINEKSGWKASYESLQIITCSQAEYEEWAKNTNPDFTPIEETKPYLYQNTYYYTYDGNEDQQYLSAEWGKRIEQLINTKAGLDFVNLVNKKVDTTSNELKTNYLNSEQIQKQYVSINAINLEDPESFLSKTLGLYYTKVDADNTFVTKDELRGDTPEGEDNFVFVTKDQYTKDQQVINTTLEQTLKTNSDGSLNSIILGSIKSKPSEDGSQLNIEVKNNGLYIGQDYLAKKSEVPNIITISASEYKTLTDQGKVDPDSYYYLYNTDENLVYVTKDYLSQTYHTINQYQTWIVSNYYNKKTVEDKLLLKADAELFVSKQDAKTTYLSINNATATYATIQALNALDNTVKTEYVTKADLKGPSLEGDNDFIFVTQTNYNKDKSDNATAFNTKTLTSENVNTSKITLSNKILNIVDNNLQLDSDQLAFQKNVPKIVCLSDSDYESLENKEINTYYYTYNALQEKDNGYVTYKYLETTYHKKSQVEQLIATAIKPLKDEIQLLKQQIESLNAKLPNQ